MPIKVGEAGQIINFNFVSDFVAENFNKLLWANFSTGVLKFTYTDPPLTGEIEITEFSGLVRPKNKDFLVKIDTLTSLKLVADPTKTYLVSRMDWITSPNGYDYSAITYGVSGYSGYFTDPLIACNLNPNTNNIDDPNHHLSVGDVVRFSLSVVGVTKDIDYYVVSSAPGYSFKVSPTAGGAEVKITGSTMTANTYRKMNSHIVRFDLISSTEFDSTYDILLAELTYTGSALTAISTLTQTKCYLMDYCINYDLLQRSGVRTLLGTNPDHLGAQSGTYWYPGNASGNIPVSNGTINTNLNAQYLNGITASNSANSVALKNNILSKNTTAARLFLNGYEYAIGQSGITSYSGFSGYTGISGWSGVSGYSSYSGYLPINNSVLQTSLNVEYFGGYRLEDFSSVGHTHNLDEIADGTTYIRVIKVDVDGLITTEGIGDGVLEYRHQSLTTPFRYDETSRVKMFALAGEIGQGGSLTVTFKKEFAYPPRVFILNNESRDWKAVNESDITATGFIVNHVENTKSDGGGDLIADTTTFSTHWLACGELL
jgi:hypothetical protein